MVFNVKIILRVFERTKKLCHNAVRAKLCSSKPWLTTPHIGKVGQARHGRGGKYLRVLQKNRLESRPSSLVT